MPLVPTKFEISAVRLLYDVSFFIIVTTIGLNIVFGIIVDTFSELRDERVCVRIGTVINFSNKKLTGPVCLVTDR